MFFIINSQGTTQGVLYEPVYQGSNSANQIILVAPFAQSVNPTVAFTLPNGVQTEPFLMTPFQNDTGEILYDADKNAYNMWSVNIEYPITEYAGLVDVQFTLYLGSTKVLGTYTSAFEVGKGVPNPLPQSPGLDTYAQILNYLSMISADAQNAIENGIAYVRYVAPLPYLVNKPEIVTDVGETPLFMDLTGSDFTKEGMTKYLTDEDLKNPNSVGGYFYECKENYESAGFVITFPPYRLGMIQIYVYNVPNDVELTIKYITPNGTGWTQVGKITLNKSSNPYAIQILQFSLGAVTYDVGLIDGIMITQDTGNTANAFICKGIEIWDESGIDGKYEIAFNNGVKSYIDTFNARELISIVNGMKTQAEKYALDSQKWAIGSTDTEDEQYDNSAKDWANKSESSLNQILSKAGQVGGYPILANIDGAPKIPAVYINQVDVHNQIPITNKSELATITAQPGDVAYLVTTVEGVQTVTKSWILLSIENGTRNWAVYGSTYATSAGNATYAQTAGNAELVNGVAYTKISQSAYDALQDKTGIYFVIIGE